MSFISKFFSIVVSPFRILSSYCIRLIPGLSKLGKLLGGLSLAAIIAWLMLLSLLIVLGAGVLRYLFSDPAETAARNWSLYFLVAFCAMPVICVAVYWLVRLAMQKSVSRYPDLDEAWELGIEALRRRQIDIRRIPLFVVHGNESAAEAHRIIKASEFKPTVEPPEHADLALSWFANETAVYLFITKASCLGALSASDATSSPSSDVRRVPAVETAGKTIGDDMDVESAAVQHPNRSLSDEDHASDNAPSAPATVAAGRTLTNDLDEPDAPISTNSPKPRGKLAKRIGEHELQQQQARLRYVCGMLKQIRRPVCGMNGVLSIAPFEQVEINSAQIATALQTDLNVLQNVLAIRCPAILLITEMQEIDGFMELVKRLAPTSTPEDRIGRGCETWGKPSKVRMEGVAAHASGAFEDLVFKHFRKKLIETLQSPNNGKLISLLCRTRGTFAKELQRLLGSVYGCENADQELPLPKQFLFSGCYFAATGVGDEFAYVKGVVIGKLSEKQSKLEWGKQALREDAAYQNWSNIFGVCGMLAFFVVVVGAVSWLLPMGDK